jgi:hypothetical protein
MKMPGQLDFGVQTLGRPDAAAMRFKAGAEQEASMAWGKALGDTGKAVADIAIATGQADAAQTLAERVAMDKRSTAELDAWLATNQSFDTMTTPLPDEASGASAPAVPEAVLRAAEKLGLTGQVDVYEIAVLASKEHLDATTAASKEAMGAKDSSKQAITKYIQQMDTAWAGSASNATQVHTIKRIEHLAARADVSYTAAINSLDEGAAMQIITDSEQSGIWTPEYAAIKLQALGSTIDQVAGTRMYRDAATQADLDLADDFVDKSRIEPAQRIAMMKLSDQQQEKQYTVEMRKQPVNYGKAQAQLIGGTLTINTVKDLAATGKISGAHANTLRLALEAPARTTSEPKVVSDLRGEITLLRFRDDDFNSSTQRARVMRDQLRTAFTGMTPGGKFVGKTLAGNDFEELMGLVDEHENKSLGQNGQRYANAKNMLKIATKYSDALDARIEGDYPEGQAYAAGLRGLQDHMDTMGTEANPTEWVTRNAQNYDPTVYIGAMKQRLTQQYPQYADMFAKLTQSQPIPKMGSGEWYVTAGTIMNTARQNVLDNTLTETEYRELRRSLSYWEFTSEEEKAKSETGISQ